ncbi:hypothetical protein BDV25DRAFT_145683 [Aspergillus avenaceus]|uniref:SEC7 domain-containing protein n=1 Tax=Aspergillus avenaceus TaxID=36643 RepID=A0A5N6TDR3_ASPAV|nr:hypothetical protein BDV25DRAFT_145683 [Aspergillus avenaceus]
MLQQHSEMHANNSPPQTPPPAGPNGESVSRTDRHHPSVRETFLDTGDNGGMDSGDERDPHDLSLSPKHASRTSIVDNMLLSLDQFASSNASVLDDYRLFNSVFESDLYGRGSPDSMAQRRYRGHTFSSSLSSEVEYSHDDAAGRFGNQAGRARRSTSSSNYNPSIRRFGSARSPECSNTYGQLYDYRTNPASAPGSRGARKSSKGSSSSHLDFGPPLARNHGTTPVIERRSASFDYGSRQAYIPFVGATSDHGPLSFDGGDAAPTPSIPGGPRKHYPSAQGDYTGISNLPTSRTPIASRRNSVKSARTKGTATISGRDNELTHLGAPILEPPPAIPGASLDPPAPSPTISFNKPIFHVPSEPAPIKERPGFFRRVFGSSKNSTSGMAENNQVDLSYSQEKTLQDLNITTKDRRQPPKASTAGANPVRQGTHQVVNKKSSFFRRRKRSVTENAPSVSMPQEPGLRPDETTKPQPSPVSSLRKVMNPYIAEAGTPASIRLAESRDRTAGADSQENPRIDPLPDTPKDNSTARCENSKPKYSLYPTTSPGVARATSFLGNNSEEEDSAGKPSCLESASPTEVQCSASADCVNSRDSESSNVESDGLDGAPRAKAAPQDPVVPSLSPVAERLSQKSNSPIDCPEEARPQNENHLNEFRVRDGANIYDDSPDESNKAPRPTVETSTLKASASNISNYFTASSTPIVSPVEQSSIEIPENPDSGSGDNILGDKEQAEKLYNSEDQIVGNEPAAAWLGDPDRATIRKAYMECFDWSTMNILAALRSLCTRLVLKGETQQVDRVLDAFSVRWCECNPNHGFKAADVVHTICYSLLLLNTDLHLADIEQKMTKNQFVRNTMPTIHRVAVDAAPSAFDALHTGTDKSKLVTRESVSSTIDEAAVDKPAHIPAKLVNRLSRTDLSVRLAGDPESDSGPLVNVPFYGTIRAWEQQVETVLRDFYTSIQKQRLPLHGAQAEKEVSRMSTNHLLSPNPGGLRRSPSTVSRSGSDIYPRGRSADSRYGTARWSSKNRSRARLYPPSAMGSSRTSLDEQSSFWSPSASSTWSKQSLGKLTSVSVDSFGSEYMRGDYQQSIGFANALSQAIIREDTAHSIASAEELDGTALLEDETLQLAGAPWAKEGSLKHKHHLDSVDKRAKDRNWNECFAVIQQGWMRLFSFNSSAKSVRQKPRARSNGGVVVGGGNWTENAEEVWKFLLRQTIASALPPPGYSKSRPHVWALSLPTGAVHLFQAGTPEIVREFVSTANYWSARLSKEPLVGGISNMEYGWSDAVINSALITAENSNKSPPSSSGARPSIQSSIRSSIDQQGSVRPRLPADRVHISDWAPPQQSMVASNLPEEEQLKALQAYVKNVEEDLQRHNELRPAMVLAFSPRHPNAMKSMANWERKSSYLLREIVKFRTYIDSLQGACDLKKKVYGTHEESNPLE